MFDRLRGHIKLAGCIFAVLFVGLIGFLFLGWTKPLAHVEYGVTFSRVYAQDELGIDPDPLLVGLLDEMGVRRFRIPVYWERVEPRPGEWNFDDLDRDIQTIKARGGHVILAFGEKVPRWPECWGPGWWKSLPREEQNTYTMRMLEKIVTRYRDESAIATWQVENEPYFPYGACPFPRSSFFKQEIQFVRSLDPTRPVVTTDSGESSPWIYFGSLLDGMGVSIYRVMSNPYIGVWRYRIVPPWLYYRKSLIAGLFGQKNIYVSEFQAEPWSDEPLKQTPIEQQMKTMDLKQLKSNIHFAEQMHISPIDFWGAEWWWWMKEKQGHPEFWETMKTFLADHK